ncbi:unnamed protein product, partial [Ascophyllum nodosum]
QGLHVDGGPVERSGEQGQVHEVSRLRHVHHRGALSRSRARGLQETLLYMRVCNTIWVDPAHSREGWYKLRQKYAELDQECSTFPASIEKRNIFRKSELCRWVTKLEVRLGHSFHKDLFGGGFHEEAEWDPTTNRATDLSNECSGVRAAEEVARGGRTG